MLFEYMSDKLRGRNVKRIELNTLWTKHLGLPWKEWIAYRDEVDYVMNRLGYHQAEVSFFDGRQRGTGLKATVWQLAAPEEDEVIGFEDIFFTEDEKIAIQYMADVLRNHSKVRESHCIPVSEVMAALKIQHSQSVQLMPLVRAAMLVFADDFYYFNGQDFWCDRGFEEYNQRFEQRQAAKGSSGNSGEVASEGRAGMRLHGGVSKGTES